LIQSQMTITVDERKHVRELIQSFARIDECFDFAYQGRTDTRVLNRLHSLCAFLEFLLSFPLQEKINGEVVLDSQLMERFELTTPASSEIAEADLDCLRERLRDVLYEFLIRTDHCSAEQLVRRGIHIPSLGDLSLVQLLQVVVSKLSECMQEIDPDDRL
jgi:hypothetical protein